MNQIPMRNLAVHELQSIRVEVCVVVIEAHLNRDGGWKATLTKEHQIRAAFQRFGCQEAQIEVASAIPLVGAWKRFGIFLMDQLRAYALIPKIHPYVKQGLKREQGCQSNVN